MFAELTNAGTKRTLRFERHIARPIEKVFAALITPARIADWLLADAIVEPHPGGRFELSFRNGPHRMIGKILRHDPPHLLEWSWIEAETNGDSRVLWQLTPSPGGTTLVMTHTLNGVGADEAANFASGWHWHLDCLPDAVDGVATPWSDAEWRRLRGQYAEKLDAN